MRFLLPPKKETPCLSIGAPPLRGASEMEKIIFPHMNAARIAP